MTQFSKFVDAITQKDNLTPLIVYVFSKLQCNYNNLCPGTFQLLATQKKMFFQQISEIIQIALIGLVRLATFSFSSTFSG